MKLSVKHGCWAIASSLFVVLPLLAVTAQEPPVKGNSQTYAPDRVLVAFKQTVTQRARLAAVSRSGLQVDATAQSDHFVRLKITPTQLAAGLNVKTAIAALKADPAVRVAEPDWIVRGQDFPNDPLFSEQWSFHSTGQNGFPVGVDIDAPEAWDVTHGNPTLKVAVIDSGVDYTHEDLTANILRDAKGRVVGYDFANKDADPMDDLGHGTHVSGTIGAVQNNGIGVSGVCPLVKIMPLKFLNADNWGWYSDAILSIDFARTHGARIMNNSWGGTGYSQLLLESILRARSAGILFVVSAMNDTINIDADPVYPAGFNRVADNVVSVAASNRSDNIASFSNYGPSTVDIAAPGSFILSTLPGNTYDYYSGTSMAAPHVSGTAALVLAKYPTLKYWQVVARLMGNVDHPSGVEGRVKTGRLNAASALVSDTIAPSSPKLFGVSQRAATALRLQWTAGGDDKAVGQASFYDMRYSTSPITATNFLSAARVEGLPTPAISGTVQSVVKMGLSPGTTYYLALRSIDNGGNASVMVSTSVATLPDALTTTILEDNGEGAGLFVGDAPWTLSAEDSYSPTHSYTDSDGNTYVDNLNVSLTQGTSVFVPADQAPTLSFWVKHDLEWYFDRLNFEVSKDDGATWHTVGGVTGWSGGGFVHVEVPLAGYGGTSLLTRFRLLTDADDHFDGVHVDDIQIRGEQLIDFYRTNLIADVKNGVPGAIIPFRAKLKRGDTNNPIAGKQVDFYDTATNAFLGFGTTDSLGNAYIMATVPADGVTQLITAKFAGDTSYAPSTSTGKLTGGNVDTRVQVTTFSTPAGQTVSLRAALSWGTQPQHYIAGETLTFKVDGAQVGTAVTNEFGVALVEYTVPSDMSLGAHIVEASFEASGLFHGSKGTGKMFVRDKTTLTMESVTGNRGEEVTLSGTLVREDGSPLYNERLYFVVDNVTIGYGLTDSNGQATLNYLIPGAMAAGTHEIKVMFHGSDFHEPSSASATLTVN